MDDTNTPDVDGAESFKKAAVKYFTHIKKVYDGYIKIAEAESDMDRQNEIAALQQLAQKGTDVVTNFKSAQKKFVTTSVPF